MSAMTPPKLQAPQALLVLTNCPDGETAARLAAALVDARLAACANVQAPCASIYRWQGQVEMATETPLLLKTATDRYPELEAKIRELHPYEVPEIIALPLTAGLPAYLDWVVAETRPE